MKLLRINGVISLDLKIMKSTGKECYDKCIGERFTIHSESKKGGKGKYIVRIPKHLRWLMNGYMYGWVDKEHCILLKPLPTYYKLISFNGNGELVEHKEEE